MLSKCSKQLNILIVPDSFKGTMDSMEAAEAIRVGFLRVFPEATYCCFPLADGGEGSSSIVGEQMRAKRVEQVVHGPYGAQVPGFYYFSETSRTAFIELAAASGLALVKDQPKRAEHATTYGTGELVASAINLGAEEIILFLGGSATTDGFVGLAKALGFEFHDGHNQRMPAVNAYAPTYQDFPGEQLSEIATIVRGHPTKRLATVSFRAIADVENPLYGANGAAIIYGPQKGADKDCVARLDRGLRNLADIVKRDLAADFAETPGAGAAGGAGFGMLSFLGGKLQPGAQFFLDLVGFDQKVKEADLVITGEGQLDAQSVAGKLLKELLARTKREKKPLLSLSGVIDLKDIDFDLYPHLLAFGLGRTDALSNPRVALTNLACQVARVLAIS